MRGLAPLRKPSCCPKCGGVDVRRIFFGLPNAEAMQIVDRGEAVLGGCAILEDRPDWRCHHCRHKWFLADDPARIERERFIFGLGGKEPGKDA